MRLANWIKPFLRGAAGGAARRRRRRRTEREIGQLEVARLEERRVLDATLVIDAGGAVTYNAQSGNHNNSLEISVASNQYTFEAGAGEKVSVTDNSGGAIDFAVSPSGRSVTVGKTGQSGDVTSVAVNMRGGDDTVTVHSAEDPLSINGGNGTDSVSFTGPGAVNITGNLLVDAETIQQSMSSSLVVSGTTTLDAGSAGTIALDAPGNDFQGAVNVLNAAGVTLQDGAGDLEIGSVTAAADVGITAFGGDLEVGSITTTAGSVVLTASGAITDQAGDAAVDIRAPSLTLTAASGIGQGAGGSLDVDVDTLTSASSDTGGVALDLRDGGDPGATVTSLNAGTSGDIVVTASSRGGSTFVFSSVSATDGNIDISADSGDLRVDDANTAAAGRTITLTARGAGASIEHTTGTLQTGGGTITLVADQLLLATPGMVDAGGGKIVLHPFNLKLDVQLGGDTAPAGGGFWLGQSAADALAPGAGGTIVVGDAALTGSIEVIGALDVSGKDLTLTTGNASAAAIRDGTAGAGGNAITGGTLSFLAVGGIDVTTSADTLNATSSTAGSIRIDESDGVTLAAISTADGDIVVQAGGTLVAENVDARGADRDALLTVTNGDIALGRVAATRTVTLSASGAIRDNNDSNGPANNVLAAALVATAGAGIGAADPLETTVGNLQAAGGSGGVLINNAGALTIGGNGAVVGVSGAGGVQITATGALMVNQSVVENGGGEIVLQAAGSGAAGDNLVIAADVTHAGDAGTAKTIRLLAGDDVRHNGGTIGFTNANPGDVLIVTADSESLPGDDKDRGSIAQAGGAVTATNLVLRAFESIDFTAGTNNAANLAANVGGGTAFTFAYSDQDDLSVTAVDGQDGVVTTGGGARITAAGGLTVAQGVVTAGGDALLNAGGSLTIGQAVDVGVGTLRLVAGAGVAQTGGTITAAALGARNNGTTGAIVLEMANVIGTARAAGTLAVFNNAAGQAVSINNTGGAPLTVGTIAAAGPFASTGGITTTGGGDATLVTAGPLGIEQAIDAGGGTVRLAAAGGVKQDGLGAITAGSLGVRNAPLPGGTGGPAGIQLLLANNVGQFAALNQIDAGAIAFSNAGGADLSIGSVTGTSLFAPLDGVAATGAGAITIDTPGRLSLNQAVFTLGAAQLTAQTGAIDGTGLLTADEGVLSAGSAIGSAAVSLSTALRVLEAAAPLGVFIAEVDAVTIGGATVGNLVGISTTDGPILVSTLNGGITVSENVSAGDAAGSGDRTIVLRAGDANHDDGVAASQFVLSPGTSVATAGAAVTIEADQMTIDTGGAASISAGAGIVTLQQNATAAANANASIDLGGVDRFDAATSPDTVVLGLSDAELNQITAGTLRIGRPDGGAILVSSAINTDDATGIGALHLLSGQGMTQNAALTASRLALTSSGAVVLDNPGNQVADLAVQTVSADVRFAARADLNIARVDSLTGIVTAGGSVVLNAGGKLGSLAGFDITTTAPANSGAASGSVTLIAAGAIDLAGTVDTRGADSAAATASSGGQVDIQAGTTLSVTMIDSSGGNATGGAGSGGDAGNVNLRAGAAQTVTLRGSIVARGGTSQNAGPGADGTVSIIAAGGLIDADDLLPDVDAGGLMVTAPGIGDGLLTDDVLETHVARLSGNVGAGGIELVNDISLALDGVTTAGSGISVTTTSGTLSVTGDVTAAGRGANDVMLTARGGGATVDVSAAVTSAGGSVTVLSDGGVTFGAAGRILTPLGNVTVRADEAQGNNGGAIVMADGALINAGSGLIVLRADGDIVLGGLQTANAGTAAITLTSSSGGIKDGGDANVDVVAPLGTLNIVANAGVGSGGNFDSIADPDPDIETQVASLRLVNVAAGDVAIDEVDDLNIDSILQTAFGFVDIDAGGTITVTPNAGGITSTAGGSVILDAEGDLVFGDGTLTMVSGGGRIIGFAGPPGGNRQIVIGKGAVLQTATGSIGEKTTGLQILAIDVATGLPVPVDTTGVSTVDTEGNTTVLITLADPNGDNFRLRIDWGDGQQDNFPGFPDPIRPFSFGTRTIQPPATTLARLDAGQLIALNKRYDGNPDRTNPRARITVTGQVEFDARAQFDNGIQLFENGVQDSRRIVVPFSFQLFVPGAGLYGGGQFDPPTITLTRFEQPARVETPVAVTVARIAPIERIEQIFTAITLGITDQEELVLVVVDVQGNEAAPIPLKLDLFEGNGLLQMLRGMPNGRYRVKFKPAGGIFQTLFDLKVDQGRLFDVGRQQSGPPQANAQLDGQALARQAPRPVGLMPPADSPDAVAAAPPDAEFAPAEFQEAAQRESGAGHAAGDGFSRWRSAMPLAGGAVVLGAAALASREGWSRQVDAALENGRRSLRKPARLVRRLMR